MYDYNLEMLYALINQHNLQQVKNQIVNRMYLTDMTVDEIEALMKKDKQEDTNNESKEMRAIDFF